MSPDIKNRPSSASTDKDSFEAIFTRYYPLVYQLAYRCVGRSDEAEDITQEVFLRYYRMPPRATSEAEQRAWLCRVATNLGLNALRAHQRRTSREEQVGEMIRHNAPDEEAQQNPEQHALADEQAALVRSVLAELPERQQAYLLLRSIGLSYAEIAQATGVATASVGALLARAEREFRRKYHERATANG
jgi:RNA polymerase sigma factor (sigma-70 family)